MASLSSGVIVFDTRFNVTSITEGRVIFYALTYVVRQDALWSSLVN